MVRQNMSALKVEVIGVNPPCPRCKKTEENARKAAKKKGRTVMDDESCPHGGEKAGFGGQALVAALPALQPYRKPPACQSEGLSKNTKTCPIRRGSRPLTRVVRLIPAGTRASPLQNPQPEHCQRQFEGRRDRG